MQRTLSSEMASTALSLSRAWSGSATAVRMEEAIAGGLSNFWAVRSQHTSCEPAADASQPAASLADLNRSQGSSAQTSGTRSIHSSANAEKEVPAPVIGTRDTCYHAAPACIDITAEIRAAAQAEMTWQAYVQLQRSNPC